MSGDPFVSIISPFLNVGPYLGEAIDSVLRQDFDEWELILVDDGSDDAGPEIAREYQRRHPDRITVVHHPGQANRGSSASRNLGAEVARGPWLAYLDADDVWLPGKLAEQVGIARRYPEVGLVVGATVYWHSWNGSDTRRDEVLPVGAPQNRIIEPPRLLTMLYPLNIGTAPSVNTMLVRASLVRQVGGWEHAFPTAYDDQALLVKLYLETPTYVASSCWDLYRQRPGSTMSLELQGKDYHRNRRRFLEWFEGYLLARGLAGTEYWSELQRALHPYRHPVRARAARLTRRAFSALTGWRSQG